MLDLDRFIADCRAAHVIWAPYMTIYPPLGPEIIHSVTNPIPRLTGAIHVYGGDFFGAERSEWDPESLVEGPYDAQKTMRCFEEANAARSQSTT